jgi:hypothetical protein
MGALSTLYTSVYQALTGDALWQDRVYPDMVPAQIVRPYVVFFVTAGGERNNLKKQDADFSLVVKCVAEDMATALDGADRIAALLNDKGEQDGGTVTGDASWIITTIQQMRAVQQLEMVDNNKPLYNSGHMFNVMMETL